ncbi:MAG: class II aldolase/adducin family protein [Bacteroidales bacterium]|nr:class II aldolase/adducin family protein [Bacteroidales bacterium]
MGGTAKNIARALGIIYRKGLTTTSGGNLSALDSDGNIWITPAGVDKGALTEADIVRIGPQGGVEGRHLPSSEHPFHRAIYRVRPDLRAIIHAHPPAITAFSIARRKPEAQVTPYYARMCGALGYADYRLPGTDGLAEVISACFRGGCNMVVMENHGLVVGGSHVAEALQRLEALETLSKAQLYAAMSGDIRILSGAEISHGLQKEAERREPDLLQEQFPAHHAMMDDLLGMRYRGWKSNLLTGVPVSMSVRTPEGGIVSAPPELPSWALKPDLLPDALSGTDPLIWLHRLIYQRHTDIGAIFIAAPAFVLSFLIRHESMNARTIPESWILLRDIPLLDGSVPADDPGRIAEALSVKSPVVMVAGHFIVTTGKTPLQAFDRLEVAELTARTLRMASCLGNIHHLSDNDISGLREKYFPGE